MSQSESAAVQDSHDDIIYPGAIPFVLVHLACLAVFWSGVTTEAVVIGIVLYWVRMVGVTGGYHRYFSHRTYKTSRVGQFMIAALAQSSAQRGVIWWAAMHRHHHQYSDLPNDTHSPRHHGFLYAHVGWIFAKRHKENPDPESVADLRQYPELVWLDEHQYVPAAILGAVAWLLAGWPGLVVGFLMSTVVLWHCTFFINSLAHVHGNQRYITGDDSRNNWWLAVITCGEGWHNNHHAYQSSTRQGFRWYQIDFTYYVLKAASWTGLIWDLRAPPADVVNNERRLGRLVVEKVARQVADTYSPDGVAAQVRAAWGNSHMWPDVQAWAHAARVQAAAKLATIHLPELPTAQEIRHRAAEHFRVPEVSLDEVAERARILLIQSVSLHILGEAEAIPA